MYRPSSSLAVRFDHVTIGFGPRLVFDRACFSLGAHEHMALVGPNGAGKSTLLRIIAGELSPEHGTVTVGMSADDVGWLRQEFQPDTATTISEFLDGVRPDLAALRSLLESDEHALSWSSESAKLLDDYEGAGGWLFDARKEEVVRGLGLTHLGADQHLSTLSGGEQTRLGLAALVLREPSLLLLDEPTNHLDVDALLWLEHELSTYKGAVLLVSHDRVFLDRVATRTLVLEDGRLEEFAGNYSRYLEEKEARLQRDLAAFDRQQGEVARLRRAAGRLESSARSIEVSTIDFAVRAKAARKARQSTVIKRRIERELDQHQLEKPKRGWTLKLDLQPTGTTGQIVVAARSLTAQFGDRVVLDDVDIELRRGERVAVVGPNGSGKSTLLRLLVGDLIPTGGVVDRGPSVRIGYVAQGREPLDPTKTVLEVIRSASPMDEEAARTFAHFLLFGADQVFTLAGRLSAGERARLAIGALVLGQVNTLVLDEPTNHLDLNAQAALAEVLSQYQGALVVASHNRAFLREIGIQRAIEPRGGRLRTWMSMDDYLESLE